MSSVMSLQKRTHSTSACNVVRDERMEILYFKEKEPKYGSIGASKSREFWQKLKFTYSLEDEEACTQCQQRDGLWLLLESLKH